MSTKKKAAAATQERLALATENAGGPRPGGWTPPPRKRKPIAPPTVHDGEGVLVFAYGSNMRIEQMRQRCPSAKFVEVARLNGHTLGFLGFSRAWGGAVATVYQDPNDSVDGVIYRISPADLLALDAFEGAPHVYQRAPMTVHGEKMKFRAHVYYRTSGRPGAPSFRYFAAIVEGRTRVGLSAEPVVQAAEQSADFPPF